MSIRNLSLAGLKIVLLLFCSICFGASDHMQPQHSRKLKEWLNLNQEYRLATLEDCECLDSVISLRKGDGYAWKPQPTYQPYYSVGDFDGNGIKDFAVVVLRVNRETEIQVLVFLMERGNNLSHLIVYPLHDKTVKNLGLFLGRNSGSVVKLLVGAFSSEAEELLIPNKRAGPSLLK